MYDRLVVLEPLCTDNVCAPQDCDYLGDECMNRRRVSLRFLHEWVLHEQQRRLGLARARRQRRRRGCRRQRRLFRLGRRGRLFRLGRRGRLFRLGRHGRRSRVSPATLTA